MNLFDAHNHLQDARLDPHRPAILRDLASPDFGIRGAIVNGTRPADWPRVARLAAELPWVIPAFGLHPWYVEERTDAWLDDLAKFLDTHPNASIGEIGLDRWIHNHHLPTQTAVFTAQLKMAAERNLPVTIHCLKAWQPLREVLDTAPLPKTFLLHAYGGPVDMIPAFVQRGAYFSFSTYFLHPRKAAQRDAFPKIPLDRILVETDAPDMAPPPECSAYTLAGSRGESLNHPANIVVAYEALAETLGLPLPDLAQQIETNFKHFCPPPNT